MTTTRLNDALNAVHNALSEEIEAAYNRGKADAKAEILALLSSGGVGAVQRTQEVVQTPPEDENGNEDDSDEAHVDNSRKRAPRGLPRALAERVLAAYRSEGCTPADIIEHAETDYERMIKLTSIRSELRRGEEEGRYREHGGIWFLANASAVIDAI